MSNTDTSLISPPVPGAKAVPGGTGPALRSLEADLEPVPYEEPKPAPYEAPKTENGPEPDLIPEPEPESIDVTMSDSADAIG